jgi:Uncharacterized protein conserved in bacteria
MRIGEVSLSTDDVIRLANFYKKLFEIDNDSDDNIHQFILTEGTGLTIYNDGKERKINSQHICLAFTVGDVDAEFERLKKLGVEIIEPPTVRLWGAKNMYFNDPDGNCIVFRSFPK